MSISSDECLICFEELDKYHVAILNCPHTYHLCCIQKWNRKSKNYSIVCPQCNIEGEIVNIEEKASSRPCSPLIPHSRNINTTNNNENNHYLVASNRERRENRDRSRRQQERTRLNRDVNRTNNSNNRNNSNDQDDNLPFFCCNIL